MDQLVNLFLYLSIIFLWGVSWIAMKHQAGIVPPDISVIYRFGLAALILFLLMCVKKSSFRFSIKQHLGMAMLGTLLFSTNFAFLYRAATYLTSGLVAIIFSSSVIMIMLNNALFFRKKTTPRHIAGAMTGFIGLCFLFWPELKNFDLNNTSCLGIILGLIGTYSFSLANQASSYCSKLNIPLLSSTFFGMLYGVLLMTLLCLFRGIHFDFDPSWSYVASWLYLAIPGSVFGFLTYLSLVKRIGPERAVYSTLFLPLIALTISTVFESFQWVWEDYVGFVMIMTGNFLVMIRPSKPNHIKRSVPAIVSKQATAS